jgi:hypothetical protein
VNLGKTYERLDRRLS